MLEDEYVFVCRFIAHPSLCTWDSKLDMSRPKLQKYFQYFELKWHKRVATDGARTYNSLYDRKENWVATGGAHRNHAVIWNDKGRHWRCPNKRKLSRHRQCPEKWCDEIKWNKRIVTGGARSKQICMYIHMILWQNRKLSRRRRGPKRNDAMNSNEMCV